MEFKNIILEKKEGIATLTLNRAKVLNALNRETLLEIQAAIEDVRKDDSARVVIITGAGDRAFGAGADIAEMKDMSAPEGRELSQLAHRVFADIENLEKPVIAAVNGFALGGGCELAMSCDIRVASEKARFGQPEINLGIIPGFSGTQRLPRLVGIAKAKELIFTGDMIDANEAERIGLANKVVPADELESTVLEMANKVAKKPRMAMKLAKTTINRGVEASLETGTSYEAETFGLCFSTADQKEGMSAFLDRREPKFKGS